MLASANVGLSSWASSQDNPEFLQPERPNFNLRRNFLQLFDPMRSESVRLDVSIGISLLDRNEQEKVQGKLERQHPYIPNAANSSVPMAALGMQNFT